MRIVGRYRNNIIQLLILLMTLLAGTALLIPIRKEADRRADDLKNRLLGELQESLGIRLEYESISPALLAAVSIKNLQITFPQGDFQIENLRVYYNPLRRFLGTQADTLRMVSRISLHEGHLNLAVNTAEGQPKTAGGLSPDFLDLIGNKTVTMDGMSAEVKINGGTIVNARDFSMILRDEGNLVRYSTESSILYRDDGNGIGTVDMEVHSGGAFSPETPAVNGRLDIRRMRTDIISLEPLAVDFTWSGSELSARRIDDERPLDISFNYGAESWSLSGEAVNLELRDMIGPGSKSERFDPFFSTVLDGRFAVEGESGRDIVYDLDIALTSQKAFLESELDLKLSLRGNLGKADIELAKLESRWGSVEYQGYLDIPNIGPTGTLSASLNETLIGYPITAAFRLETIGKTITAEPLVFDAGSFDFHDFRFLVIAEDDTYALSLIAVPTLPDDSAPRRLTLDMMLDTRQSPILYGYAELLGFETGHILKLLGYQAASELGFVRNTLLDMSGSFESRNGSWAARLENARMVEKDQPGNTLSMRGFVTDESWVLDQLELDWDGYSVRGSGNAISTVDGGTADGRILIGEQSYPFEASWRRDGETRITGDFGFLAELGPKSGSGRPIRLAMDDFSVPLTDGRLIATTDLRGRIAPGDWDVSLNRMNVKLVGGSRGAESSLSIRGRADRELVSLPEIIYMDEIGVLAGSAQLELSGNANTLRGRVLLEGGAQESYDLTVLRDRDIWEVDARIAAGRMERISRDRLKGRIDLDGKVSGFIDNPRMTVRLETSDGEIDGRSFKSAASISLIDGRIRIQDMVFNHEGVSVNRGLLLANLNDGSIRTTADLSATYNQVPVSTGFSLALDFNREIAINEIPELLTTAFSGTLATKPVLWNRTMHLPSFTFHFSRDGQGFRVVSPTADLIDIVYDIDSGRLDLTTGSPLPVVLEGGGMVKNGMIDLSFPIMDLDPSLINYFMLRDPILLQYHVVFQAGRFVGNLDIRGPATDPELFGILHARDLKVDTPYTYADIGTASTDIHFKGKRITIDRIDVPVGEGFVYGGGHVVLERLNVTDFDMTYGGRAAGRGSGVPVYYPLLGVNLDGTFTGEIRMTGGNRRYFLDGAFIFPYLKASLGSPRIPVSQTRPGRYPAEVFLNIDFITGNNCSFFLPNEQVKIVKAIAEPGHTINLVYSSQPASLSIAGRLPIKSGDIYYFDRDFQITEGSMRFDETLGDFDPILAFRAETKVRDEIGEDVSVALVYNAPVRSDFNPTIETIPARTESEILALFGQAVVPYAGNPDAGAASTVLLATTGMFGQVGLVQPFEEVLREGLNLDMVTIRTDIIENTLAAGLSRTTDPGGDTQSFGLGQYLDNTSLFAGKYIGNALFISGTVSANYFEGQRLRSVFGGLEFETEVSLEMETPFFNVAWSYSPDPTSDEGFVADNEISLKWQFSF